MLNPTNRSIIIAVRSGHWSAEAGMILLACEAVSALSLGRMSCGLSQSILRLSMSFVVITTTSSCGRMTTTHE